jgi:chromosome segregation protein
VFLRSLSIRGFKSFAEKTTLEFRPGISVIVGPNGSGKSNIVDAIAWVLGEQGPRALRGGQMADVIFAGSPGRPALGMAEVRMVIDNAAGLIPLPASEIEISRTVFRSGESEYRLGGRPCRLLDIQELLSDSGMGRALHTIVGQGQLDAVLSARPEERRQFVEEAAGIAKHRRRRERAERKLAGLEGDLLRLQDLVGELRRQLKPLKQQAELAERHEALTGDAAQLAAQLAAARLRALYRDRDLRGPSWKEAEDRRAEVRAGLDRLDAEIARIAQEQAEAQQVERLSDVAHSDAQRAKSAAEARLRTALREEAQAGERLSVATGRSGRLFALEEEMARTQSALEEVSRAMAQREDELEAAERIFRAAEQGRRDAEAERRARGEEAAARRAEMAALQQALSGHEAEVRRLASALEDVREKASAEVQRASDLETEVERLDALETPLAAEQSALQSELALLAATLTEVRTRESGLSARQEVVDARRAELSESPGQAFARRRGERPIGVLVELVEVPTDLRPALRAALGGFADAVVYSNRAAALADATSEGASGVVLAVAADIPERPTAHPSGERRLLDAVQPDSRVRGLVAELLAGVYIAHNLTEAAARQQVHSGSTFVTLDGTVVGPLAVHGPAGIDARLEGVRRESAALERELAGMRRQVREGKLQEEALRARAEGVRTELERIDRLITAAAEEAAQAKAQVAALGREEQLVTERFAAAAASAQGARRRMEETPVAAGEMPALPPMPEPPVHLRVEVEALRRERARLEAGVARARRDIEALSAEDPVALRNAVEIAQAERVSGEAVLREAEAVLDQALVEHRQAAERARRLQADHDAGNRAWREQSVAADRIRLENEDQDRARLELEHRIGDAERLLREGHGADPEAAVAALAEDETVEELQRRSEAVARRLGLLGRVNLLAVGELDALQERHDFLVRELEDVRAARRDLEEVIRQVDLRMAELFESAFRDVSREFTELFATLFPGGEGRLVLLDPKDLLGSGIEVEARPGRKRVRRLSLLSGGERSLAALAFLFAIFRARPSPFYLMDEVEAALDDVNLRRFLDMVGGFAERTQMLLVTHQKRTMEAADILYGVSMGKGGASRVVSQRLAEVGAG